MTIHTHFVPATLAVGLCIAAISTPIAASTEAATIFTAPISAHEASKTKRYAINPELGRAWVEIDIVRGLSETSESHRVTVPGLSYQAESSQVVFEADGRSVVCADVRDAGRWIFKHQRIVPTGACELTPRYVTVPQDDGFGVDLVEYFEVRFEAGDMTAADAEPRV